jgi:hypothetical protein
LGGIVGHQLWEWNLVLTGYDLELLVQRKLDGDVQDAEEAWKETTVKCPDAF